MAKEIIGYVVEDDNDSRILELYLKILKKWRNPED